MANSSFIPASEQKCIQKVSKEPEPLSLLGCWPWCGWRWWCWWGRLSSCLLSTGDEWLTSGRAAVRTGEERKLPDNEGKEAVGEQGEACWEPDDVFERRAEEGMVMGVEQAKGRPCSPFSSPTATK